MADLEQAAVWHRQIAALVAAADRAGVASGDLPAVRSRLGAQVAEFTRVASLAGAPLPALQPTASEIAAVTPALGDLSEAAAAQLLRTASTTLDAADAALRGTPAPIALAAPAQSTGTTITQTARTDEATQLATPVTASRSPVTERPATRGVRRWPDPARNAVVYGICMLVGLVLQGALFLSNSSSLPLLALAVPAFAWVAGWLLVAGLFEPPASGKLNRSPRLGALICLAPDILLCGGLAFSFVNRFFG